MSDSIKELNKKHWDNYGKNHSFFTAGIPIDTNDLTGEIRAKYRTRTEYNHLKRKLNLKNKTILDLGCGSGRMSFQFAKKAKKVIGIDFSDSSINLAKSYKEKLQINNVEFFVSDIQSLNLSEPFDIIFFGGVLMCIPDKDVLVLLEDLHLYLAENGIVINRDTLSLSETFTTEKIESRTDFAIYRTVEEYNAMFSKNYETLYFSEVYPFLISYNIYKRLPDKLKSSKAILFLFDISLRIQSAFMDSLLLKFKFIYKRQSSRWTTRQYYFFHTLKSENNAT